MTQQTENGLQNSAYSGDVENEDKIEEIESETTTQDEKSNILKKSNLLYGLNDVPPWYLCIAFGLQHYLLTIGSLVGLPLLLADKMCIAQDELGNVARANLIGSMFVVSGVCTLLQTFFGNRLPIMQGSSFAFLPPTLTILALPHNQCPDPLPPTFMNSSVTLYNDTDGSIVDGEELWHRRIREVQGAITIASTLEILLGLTGAVGFMVRFIGPLTIVPTISLIGLDLFSTVASNAEQQWGIAIGSAAVLVLCSQYLTNVRVPFPAYNKSEKFHFKWIYFFKLFPVLITLLLAWLVCLILTITNVFPNDPSNPNYQSRTDIRADVIRNSPWFRVPYPCQWGLPKITIAGFFGMLAAIIASIIESTGDYHACARLAEAPPPPTHALNRGIMMEGIGCVFAGLVGTTSGTTSFSQNIAAIGITRVGSRKVLQTAGAFFVFLGIVGKFGSIFVTIPDSVIGGLFLVMFGMIAAIGLSNLQFVDLNSNRNIFIIGFTLLTGLTVSNWMKENPGAIQTGVPELDQIFTVLLNSATLIGGCLGMFLDNTLPGTPEERGMVAWRQKNLSDENTLLTTQYLNKCYDLPFKMCCPRLAKYIPFLPGYTSAADKQNEKKETFQWTEQQV